MQLTEEQIKFLDKVCTGKWTLNENGEVDVKGGVFMEGMNLTEIPVKFNRVDGHFFCYDNQLTTLKNCPVYIGHSFRFYKNNLTEYFKNINQEDFSHWKRLRWGFILYEYPFMINIGKKYIIRSELEYYLNRLPQTKLYLE